MATNENTSLCSACGGKCCKQYAGIVSPHDLDGDDVSGQVLEMIKGGKYCLDLWDADSRLEETFFLRPRHKNSMDSEIDASWGGECVFLTPMGCQLIFEKRPKQCRALEPNPKDPGDCNQHHDKLSAAKEWAEFREVMNEVREELRRS